MKQPRPYLITYSFHDGKETKEMKYIQIAKHSFDACMLAGIDFISLVMQSHLTLDDPKIVSVKRLTQKEFKQLST